MNTGGECSTCGDDEIKISARFGMSPTPRYMMSFATPPHGIP
jgi:hypothetical protein